MGINPTYSTFEEFAFLPNSKKVEMPKKGIKAQKTKISHYQVFDLFGTLIIAQVLKFVNTLLKNKEYCKEAVCRDLRQNARQQKASPAHERGFY